MTRTAAREIAILLGFSAAASGETAEETLERFFEGLDERAQMRRDDRQGFARVEGKAQVFRDPGVAGAEVLHDKVPKQGADTPDVSNQHKRAYGLFSQSWPTEDSSRRARLTRAR